MTERAFHTVWLPLQGRFYRVAFYLLEDEADAKDAVQELYLKLWTLRDHLELIREPAAYGSLLMKNLCIDRIRKRKPREALREDQADDPPPDRQLELREELKDVLGKMDALPPNQRKLLGMRVLQGLSYDQISQQTGLSPLNIRVQISLARKKIKA
ncbi:MAG: RNA polymerase sigma factor [Candidatus Cryptobacteroides sp.]|jgi:RNA polymerase sigma-70 factor (ECF subfamily)|nr:RNA polymerase sigma factor [Bacteroidales bacterium]MEE3466310.1 RNA polymerase sigma factor [Candidatus Cryptobacteroides sp.]